MTRRAGTTGTGTGRVVVVGAGFAGLAASRALPATLDVTVVDQRPEFEFLPNIHEIVSGVKTPESLRLPLAELVAGHGHRFLQDEVTGVDRAARLVATGRHGALSYDVLLLAIGGVNATHGVPGVAEHALPFKSVDDCLRIATRLDALAGRSRRATIVIVGGGLEGVEALGEVLRRHRGHGRFVLHLVEGRACLLGDTPAALDAEIRALAAPYAVTFHTRARVAAVARDAVTLDSGVRLAADAVIWTGGPAAPPLLATVGLAARPPGWAPVTPALQSRVDPAVFVLGDAADHPGVGRQAYHALDMGTAGAANAVRRLAGRPLAPFRPAEKPMLVSFGDLSCFLVWGRVALAGSALAAGKEAVFQLVMTQLDGRGWTQVVPGELGRLWQAACNLGWPTVSSLAAMRRQMRLRLLAA